MKTEDLNPSERQRLNQRILEYNKSREPLPVFLEIMKLDLSDRPYIRKDIYEIVEKIARLQPVESV